MPMLGEKAAADMEDSFPQRAIRGSATPSIPDACIPITRAARLVERNSFRSASLRERPVLNGMNSVLPRRGEYNECLEKNLEIFRGVAARPLISVQKS